VHPFTYDLLPSLPLCAQRRRRGGDVPDSNKEIEEKKVNRGAAREGRRAGWNAAAGWRR